MIEDSTRSLFPSVLADFSDNTLLRLSAGERLWKLYLLRPASGRDEHVEHRIYTKEQVDDRVGLISYNLRKPATGAPVRSALAYTKDIPKDTLNQLIWRVVRETNLSPEELVVIDLSRIATLEEQISHLRRLEKQP